MASTEVIVLKHYTCVECGLDRTRTIRMPLEDWQAYQNTLADTDQCYAHDVGGAPANHKHLHDVCDKCRRLRIHEEAQIEELLVPPVPQLMSWKQRIQRVLRKLFQ